MLGSNNQCHRHPGDFPGGELAKVEVSWPRRTHRLLCTTSLAYCTIHRSAQCLCFLLLLSASLLLMVPTFPVCSSSTKAMTLRSCERGLCLHHIAALLLPVCGYRLGNHTLLSAPCTREVFLLLLLLLPFYLELFKICPKQVDVTSKLETGPTLSRRLVRDQTASFPASFLV